MLFFYEYRANLSYRGAISLVHLIVYNILSVQLGETKREGRKQELK